MAAKKNSSPKSKAKSDETKRISANDVVEVAEFLDIQQELTAIKAEYPEVFRMYAEIAERYNAALEAADKAVRAKGVSCGPFDCYSSHPKYNGEKMYEELGEKLFLACGGSMQKRIEYSVDKAKVEAAIASGKIPEECVPEFKSTQRSYHKPEPISV